ncbi:ectonucleotide pyrophosphatase/phosphodiesterase [Sphingomonas sp. 10B4]|uniref:alkaline phosphatase family protein n=1 Tax=Sphingomonas sp. 10B4 TaxID=3048575 RepID=UPI002AB3D8BE|nr:ectonucleotide pyrophosphatase/phosphodiesterase [Sphingomonas sp. 10B4]MDY7526250.1 ectonucleotide pyrophosphatase/phosphodiesterase [Sphingomonas sp. 10B4]MEB0283476.1 ectonucleotide pyrophosphatase/phosphodiesterase [Sphingomonas sp. 10B4]
MISIDGFRAEDLAHPDEAGIHVPRLQALAEDGVEARAVINVAPTLTYPNHTTLMTGVAPAVHGIIANQRFDPEGVLRNSVYWYAREIAVPTLWDAVHRSGGKVANVYWPVAVGSRSIDINFPELWAGGQSKDWPLIAAVSNVEALDPADRHAPRAALERLIAPTTAGDSARVDLALSLFAHEHPSLLTVHLVSLDETQHHLGIRSNEKRRAIDALDTMVGRLIDGARAVDRTVRFVIVSDHGQVPLSYEVNLGTLLTGAGLTTTGSGWRAAIWNVDSAYLVIRTGDKAAQAAAMQALTRYAANSSSAIDRIVPMDRPIPDRADGHIAAMVFFKAGYAAGNTTTGPLITPAKNRGQHGGSPDDPGLRSMFIAQGAGVPKRGSLGIVDMRAIAPTVAKMLDVPMPSAPEAPLF